MSAPNGRRGAKTPLNTPTPVASAGNVHSEMNPPVSQGVGQSNAGASASQATPTSTGRGQQAGGSNSAAQDIPEHALGYDRGRGGVAASSTMRDGTSQAPSEGGRDGGTPSVLGKRRSDAIDHAFHRAVEKRRAAKVTMIPSPELSTQTNVLKPKRTTNFVTQDETMNGGGIEMKVDLKTDEGWDILREAANKVWASGDSSKIAWTMRSADHPNDVFSGVLTGSEWRT